MNGQTLQDLSLLDILPPSISGDETIKALARSLDPVHREVTATIPVEIIYAALDALPDDLLAMVAWGFHIEGYDLLETREEKLHLVKHFWDYHRFKGTEHGLALYLNTYLKRDLLAASPPTKSFCGSSLTDAERAAWEAPMPEVRVYPYRHAGKRQGAFVGDFSGTLFPNTSDALLRIGEKVTLYDPVAGTEIDLDTLATERDVVAKSAVTRVPARLPGQAGRAMFCGRFSGCFFPCDTGAASRMYVLDMEVGYADEVARRTPLSVRPSLDPVRVGCEVVASPGQAGLGMFPGHRWPDAWPEKATRFREGKFFLKSRAGDRLYRRTKLFDAGRAVFNRAKASTFTGCFRLGALRPHMAEAAVDMVRTAPRGARFCGGYTGGYLCALDAAAWIDQMRRIGRMAVRLSDKVLVSITNRRQITASAGILCGDVVAGEYQLEAF